MVALLFSNRVHLTLGLTLLSCIELETEAYLPSSLTFALGRRHHQKISSSSLLFSYRRGAEIWPPPPSDEPVKLADSFPNDQVPPKAQEALQNIGSLEEEETKPVEWRKLLPRAMARILRRAASAEEDEAFSEPDSNAAPAMDKTPAVVALVLLFSGFVRPLDILLVSFLTGYFGILQVAALVVRQDGITPVLPALPPQGHVPTLVSNPLGPGFTYSIPYDRWLKLGVVIGLLAPILFSGRYALDHQMAAARVCARPIFILCCQALSEAVSRRVMTPLPLRILIPVAYNTVRLGYLWNWTFCSPQVGLLLPGRSLAALNLIYWTVNLFGFLVPVAVIRYMRAHFLCVECEQVTTRSGMEESIGLLS